MSLPASLAALHHASLSTFCSLSVSLSLPPSGMVSLRLPGCHFAGRHVALSFRSPSDKFVRHARALNLLRMRMNF